MKRHGKRKAVDMPKVSHWAWMKRVTTSNMLWPLKPADAYDIWKWTVERGLGFLWRLLWFSLLEL